LLLLRALGIGDSAGGKSSRILGNFGWESADFGRKIADFGHFQPIFDGIPEGKLSGSWRLTKVWGGGDPPYTKLQEDRTTATITATATVTLSDLQVQLLEVVALLNAAADTQPH
jgi:hypothetical protein